MPDSLDSLSLHSVRRMLEGVVPPTMCSASADGTPHVNYLSLAEYVDAEHIALSFQFFNASRENVLATRHISLSIDDPYTGAGVVMQLLYLRTETEGATFERIRAKLAGIASHTGMENVFHLRGADIYRVLEMRLVPGRRELPAARPRCDLVAGARTLSERLAACEGLAELLDAMMSGLAEQLLISHAMLWLLDEGRETMTLLASHGYEEQATGLEIPVGDGLAGTAAREGVPIRVGHMVHMRVYGRAVRERATQLGLDPLLRCEIPLPGLPNPRSQLAVPLRVQGRVLGVLFVESEHDQCFGYDDEDALMLLGGQFALGLTLMRAAEPEQGRAEQPAHSQPQGTAVAVRYYAQDSSVFLDNDYLIKGVAGAIFWKLARELSQHLRGDFTTRELRLAGDELRLPDVQDNLDVRLLVLQRRLAERAAPVQIEKTGRGRFRLIARRPLRLVDASE